MPTPAYKGMDLIPPIRKHTFSPEVDLSELIDGEAEFEALSGIDWSSPTFSQRKMTKSRQRMTQKTPSNKAKKTEPPGGSKHLSFWKTLRSHLARGGL